jgi:hypothetical protein
LTKNGYLSLVYTDLTDLKLSRGHFNQNNDRKRESITRFVVIPAQYESRSTGKRIMLGSGNTELIIKVGGFLCRQSQFQRPVKESLASSGALSESVLALVAVVATGLYSDFRIMLFAFVRYLAADGTARLSAALVLRGAAI